MPRATWSRASSRELRAAVGVLSGALVQAMKQRQAAQAKQQQAAQQQTARNQQRSTFDRAFAACTEARGYAVK